MLRLAVLGCLVSTADATFCPGNKLYLAAVNGGCTSIGGNLVLAGLEEYSAAIISEHLGTPVRRVLHPPKSAQWAKPSPVPADLIFAGEAGMCVKLAFSLPRPRSDEAWVAQHALLASLPCTIGLFAPLALVSSIPLTAEEGLARVEQAAASISDATWDVAVCTWCSTTTSSSYM